MVSSAPSPTFSSPRRSSAVPPHSAASSGIDSVVTLLIVFGFAVPYVPSVSRIAEGEPTPWLGVFERVSFFTWLVWVGVLALALIRRTRAARR